MKNPDSLKHRLVALYRTLVAARVAAQQLYEHPDTCALEDALFNRVNAVGGDLETMSDRVFSVLDGILVAERVARQNKPRRPRLKGGAA